MDNPKLSVVLSAYNAELFIKDAIESILNQSFQDFELLIADDGSKDQTRSIIDSFYFDARVRILHNERNIGKTATVNRLFTKCEGQYVTIHDADDISLKERFERQIEFLESNPQMIMCGCSFESFTDSGFASEGIMESDFAKIQANIVCESQFHGPTMIFNREVVSNQLNGELFRPFFQDYNEDCDLSMRLTEVGYCSNLNEVLYKYRILPNSLSKSISPRKKCLYPVLVEFHNQRLKFGSDYLQNREEDLANQLLESYILLKYTDSSKIYRESAEFLMYYDFKKEAILRALNAVVHSPLKWINWGTLQYCVRKYLLG